MSREKQKGKKLTRSSSRSFAINLYSGKAELNHVFVAWIRVEKERRA